MSDVRPPSKIILPIVSLTALSLAAGLCIGCRPGAAEPYAAPDTFTILQPAGAPPASGLPVLEPADIKDPLVEALWRQLNDGFASDCLRTVYVAKAFVREGEVEGHRYSERTRHMARDTLFFVVPAPGTGLGQGIALSALIGSPQVRPDARRIDLQAEITKESAFVQTLTGLLAAEAVDLLITQASDPARPPAPALVDGYRQAMEVIARELRGTGAAPTIPRTAGTDAQRLLFASVRDGRHAFAADGHTLRPGTEMVRDPGIVATFLHRLAPSGGRRSASDEFYAPFLRERVPAGVNPAALIGPIRNFQTKVLGAWAHRVLAGRPPADVVDLCLAYADAHPAEREAAVRALVTTTQGATVKTGGVEIPNVKSEAALAELESLIKDVVAGKLDLRAALQK